MYVPNTLSKRLQWVLRTYEKRPIVAYRVAIIAMWATGRDHAARGRVVPDYYDPETKQWARHIGGERYQPLRYQDAAEAVAEASEDRVTAFDAIVPWVAREVARYAKDVERTAAAALYAERRGGMRPRRSGYEAFYDYDDAMGQLDARAAAIAMWAERERPDLNRMTLAEVFEAVADYEVEDKDVPQGAITYRYDDGWTIQRLGPDELEAEGEIMQHCVGDYCESIEDESAIILSLRDPKGRPHVTIEVDGDSGLYVQIKGKQNEPPKPEYAKRVEEFIGWRDSVGRPAWFQGMFLLGADFTNDDLSGAEIGPYDVNADPLSPLLYGANLRDARFTGVVLSEAVLEQAELHEARFSKCEIRDSNLIAIKAWDAHFDGVKIEQSDLSDAELVNAHFVNASIQDSDLTDADLTDAKLEWTSIVGVQLVGADLTGADLSTLRSFSYVNMRDAKVDGVKPPKDPGVLHDFLAAVDQGRQ